MKKRITKFFSVFLSILILLSVIPMTAGAVSSEHLHPICDASCDCESYSHGNNTWTAWDGTTKMVSGYYYLEKDIVLSSTIVLDYNYITYLCLNGHSITCEATVFDIYSYRSLIITDCKDTGKIETSVPEDEQYADFTIKNNNKLSIWGGSVINSSPSPFGDAIRVYPYADTYIYGGSISSAYNGGVYLNADGYLCVEGGSVNGSDYAIQGIGDSNSTFGATLDIKGGVFSASVESTQGFYRYVVDITQGRVNMSGGCVDGGLIISECTATSTFSGGTINGKLSINKGTAVIKSGDFGGTAGVELDCNSEISGGTFRKVLTLGTNFTDTSHIIRGGDFTACDSVKILGETQISGGTFSSVSLIKNIPVYLSGNPKIDELYVGYAGMISAQNPGQTASFSGEKISVQVPEINSWSQGLVVVDDVTSDAVAERFGYVESDPVRYLEYKENSLVLKYKTNGTWGDNVIWSVSDGTLYISGTGAIQKAMKSYPWAVYAKDITRIVIESGITSVPGGAFEYFTETKTISLPETLTEIDFDAIYGCDSLNDLLLPSSLNSLCDSYWIYQCSSLKDLYYVGTEEELNALTNSNGINSNFNMTVHCLEPYEATVTCTEDGYAAYYRFDKTDVYGGYYDEDYKCSDEPAKVSALGHRVDLNSFIVDNTSRYPFTLKDGVYYSSTHINYTGSTIYLDIPFDGALTLNYGVSSEANDKLYISHNGTILTQISGEVSDQVMTLQVSEGDRVAVYYNKNRYDSEGLDQAWFSLDYEADIAGSSIVSAELIEAKCVEAIICDFCQEIVKDKAGHDLGEWTVTVEPTCKNSGQKCKYCSRCDYYESTSIAATGHSYSAEVIEPTCLDRGYTIYRCECGDSYVGDYKDTVTHTFTSTIIKPATHLEEGIEKFTCEFGHYYTKPIAKLEAHTYNASVTSPTCTEKGYTTYTCECGDSYISDYVDVIPHEYSSVITTPATHTEKGIRTYTCECGDSYTEDIPETTAHSYSSQVTTPATHLKEGVMTYTCACGDSYTESIGKTSGHTYKETLKKEATHLTEGLMEYTCECGDSYQTAIPTLPGHTYESEIISEPKCKEDGIKLFVCECGHSYTETIYRLGHVDDDDNGSCDRCGVSVCSHMCHKTGFMGFIWKIVLFFSKLFGSNPVCECGAAHY